MENTTNATKRATYTRNEAAKELNVSLPVLDAWMRRADNPLPHFRAGRKVLIPTEGLLQWINEEAARQLGTAMAR